MVKVDDARFDEMVSDAIDSIPAEFLDELDNVVFLVEDEPSVEQRADDIADGGTGDMLGLYSGVNLYERGDYYSGDLPDSITIFKGPHERMCANAAELAEEVRRTVVHEVGHYFGMDEAQVDQMGYA